MMSSTSQTPKVSLTLLALLIEVAYMRLAKVEHILHADALISVSGCPCNPQDLFSACVKMLF